MLSPTEGVGFSSKENFLSLKFYPSKSPQYFTKKDGPYLYSLYHIEACMVMS